MTGPTRRGFLGTGGALLGAGGLLGCRGRKTWLVPDLGAENPDDHQRATLRAMADTFLPGWDGGPGADDVDALTTIIEPDYGLNPYITELVADLDDWCWLTYGSEFVELDHADRTRALEQRMGHGGRVIQSLYKPAYEGALALTKLAYFGGLTHGVGMRHVGFPGPSRGYAPDSAAGVYPSADLGLPIPNTVLAGVRSTVKVAGKGVLTELAIDLDVRHPDPSDLSITLRSPAGTEQALWGRKAGKRGITLERAPLPAFHGQPAAGTWTLHLVDPAGAATGTLRFWQLVVRTDLDG